ncbi:MAG: hypothetical protein LAO08_11415 [Acidobacteriia bacterium]|nr:hypothetical protein [Terriglobia bacterium]
MLKQAVGRDWRGKLSPVLYLRWTGSSKITIFIGADLRKIIYEDMFRGKTAATT